MSVRDLTKQFVLRRVRSVDLPHGQVAYIRSLTEGEKSEYEQSQLTEGPGGRRISDPSKLVTARARLIALCLCESDGTLVMEPSAWPEIIGWDGAVCQAMYDAIQDHLGYCLDRLKLIAKNS